METLHLTAALNLCAAQCDLCYKACDQEKTRADLQRCMMLVKDCSAICLISLKYLIRNSENVMKLLKVCAEICEICAEECQKHDLWHCRDCARECLKCAEVCKSHYESQDSAGDKAQLKIQLA